MDATEIKATFTKLMKCNFELEYYENTATVFKTMDMPVKDKVKVTMIKFTKASNLAGIQAHISLVPWNK
jgi:hypothetical protein